jgi:tetratricopeptide (TPR) repeat protein
MLGPVTVYRVFLATPGGLDAERRAFRDALSEFNEDEALEHGIMFQPVGWEATAPAVGRPQALINQNLRACDYFVLALWDRWGSAPDTDGRYSSGSEEEYQLAMACYRDPREPMSQIAVFFKDLPLDRWGDPGPQLQKVLDFRNELEKTKSLLFDKFADAGDFQRKLRRLLSTWRRQRRHTPEHVSARQSPPRATAPRSWIESLSIVERRPASGLVTEAERLSDEGRLTDAEAFFARAILQSPDVHALSHYGRFLVRVGRLPQAEVIYEEILRIAGPGEDRWRADAYGNLGLIHRTRGRLDAAVDAVQNALEIDERTMRREDMAIHFGHLGLICRTRGELPKAEEMHRRALEIEENAGRLEGMAVQYGNLGVVYEMRGDLDRAEAMQQEALKIEQRLGRHEGIANAYGNLGVIQVRRQQLGDAETLLRKALDTDKRLGRLEGMANHYGHLGAVYRMRHDDAAAEDMLNRALEINEELGRLKGQAENYSELALARSSRGDLDGAERLLRRALRLDEHLGRLSGMAKRYELLAVVYEARGEPVPARALASKARELYAQVDQPAAMSDPSGDSKPATRRAPLA